MSKYKDETMELIEMVAKNSHHNMAKSFGRGAMPKGQLIDAKSAEMGMLCERINKMGGYQNLLLDRLNTRNGFKGLAPVSLQEASPCQLLKIRPCRIRLPHNGHPCLSKLKQTLPWLSLIEFVWESCQMSKHHRLISNDDVNMFEDDEILMKV